MADGCRFQFPRLIVTSKMQAEAAAESRDSLQVQKYAFAVSHNPVATTELPCNQCLEVCPGTKGSIIYTVSYISKVDGARDTDPQAVEVLALEALGRYIEAGRQVAPERLTEKMTLSCVNKINSMAHLSMPMIMTYLMGYPDFYSSHTHRFVSLDLFHRRMRKPEVVMVKGTRLVPAPTDTGVAFNTSDDYVDYLCRTPEDRSLAVVQWAETSEKRAGRSDSKRERKGTSASTKRRRDKEAGVTDGRETQNPHKRTILRWKKKAKVHGATTGTGVGDGGSRRLDAAHPNADTHVSARLRNPRVCSLFPWWHIPSRPRCYDVTILGPTPYSVEKADRAHSELTQLLERADAGEVPRAQITGAVVAAEDAANASREGKELRRAFDRLNPEERSRLQKYAEFVFLFFTPYIKEELDAVPSSRRYFEFAPVGEPPNDVVADETKDEDEHLQEEKVPDSDQESGTVLHDGLDDEKTWLQWRWVLRLWMRLVLSFSPPPPPPLSHHAPF